MDKFYLITNKSKDKTLEITKRIQAYIESQNRVCILAIEESKVPEDTDCILVLGGDGTLIRAAREFRTLNIPILGIKMGTLGYLTEVELTNIESGIHQAIYEKPMVEERMMLRGTIGSSVEDIALNDIVVGRAGMLRIIRFNIYVDGELLNTYQADGVIISTPTGSTAYNLSAGGPIVQPTASMIIITPICSHALNTSSIVLSADAEIIIEICTGRDGAREEGVVSFDGDHNVQVTTGDKIVIQKAEDTTKLLKLSRVSFLETLRRKMKGN